MACSCKVSVSCDSYVGGRLQTGRSFLRWANTLLIELETLKIELWYRQTSTSSVEHQRNSWDSAWLFSVCCIAKQKISISSIFQPSSS